MATFTYVPDRSFKQSVKPRVLKAQFGDGYSQRLADGINTLGRSWNVTFKNRDLTTISAITSFFEGLQGTVSFDWTPPGEVSSVKVICEEWNEEYITEDIRTITATFMRVYET